LASVSVDGPTACRIQADRTPPTNGVSLSSPHICRILSSAPLEHIPGAPTPLKRDTGLCPVHRWRNSYTTARPHGFSRGAHLCPARSAGPTGSVTSLPRQSRPIRLGLCSNPTPRCCDSVVYRPSGIARRFVFTALGADRPATFLPRWNGNLPRHPACVVCPEKPFDHVHALVDPRFSLLHRWITRLFFLLVAAVKRVLINYCNPGAPRLSIKIQARPGVQRITRSATDQH